jgi:Cu+-exporting ATPase
MAKIKKLTLRIRGMHCVSCETLVKDAILEVGGVKSANVDYIREGAAIEFDSTKTNIKDIMDVIKKVGYEPEEINEKKSKGFLKKLFG